MNSYLLRTTALALGLLATGATFAQSSSASSSSSTTTTACTARDASSGMASGKMVAGYDLKTAKGARMTTQTAAPTAACDDALPSPQAVRESPTKSSFGKSKEYTGHVTLMK